MYINRCKIVTCKWQQMTYNLYVFVCVYKTFDSLHALVSTTCNLMVLLIKSSITQQLSSVY